MKTFILGIFTLSVFSASYASLTLHNMSDQHLIVQFNTPIGICWPQRVTSQNQRFFSNYQISSRCPNVTGVDM